MKENSVAKTLQIIGYVELIAAFILALIIDTEEMFGVDPIYYGSEARWAVDKAIEIVKNATQSN